MIVGIERLRDHRDDWTRRVAVKLVDQNGVEERTLVDYIRLAGGAVYVDLDRPHSFRLVFLRFGGRLAAWQLRQTGGLLRGLFNGRKSCL